MTGLFDDLVEAPESKTSTVTPAEEVTTTEAPSTETGTEVKDSKVERETITVESLEQLPDGYVEVKGFAWALTQENLQRAHNEGRMPTQNDMVDTQAVYAATRGSRWSLPALEAVHPNGTKLGIVIPLEAGLKAWSERPERGTGTGSSATMTPQKRAERLRRAGLLKARLAKMNARFERYTNVLLPEVGATWEDADKAYEEYMETEEGKKADKDFADKENGKDE